MSDCLFCRIANGEIASSKVAETEHVLAFRDINPQAPTHVLLIPKAHVADSAADLGPAQEHCSASCSPSRHAWRRTRGLDQGWRLVTNVGEHAGRRCTISICTCWVGARCRGRRDSSKKRRFAAAVASAGRPG